MQKRFTEQAKNALALAAEAAQSLSHSYIGTEHILLGLLAQKEGTAGKVLEEFGVEPKKLLELIEKLIAPSEDTDVLLEETNSDYSPRARKVIDNASAEADEESRSLAGTEHLLLAMLRETDCVGTRLLYTMGVNIQKLYSAVLAAMG